MTYAGPLGLPQSGGLIVVRRGALAMRETSIVFDARRDTQAAEDTDLRGLLRELVAIRKAGKRK